MALIAENAADRAEQLILLSARLADLITEETRRIEAREPPLEGAAGEEKNRLANAYRLELARIKLDPALLEGAPAAIAARLRDATENLQLTLAAHDRALAAVKIISEGLVEAMAQEVVRQRGGGAAYGARGAIDARPSGQPALLDRRA